MIGDDAAVSYLLTIRLLCGLCCSHWTQIEHAARFNRLIRNVFHDGDA